MVLSLRTICVKPPHMMCAVFEQHIKSINTGLGNVLKEDCLYLIQREKFLCSIGEEKVFSCTHKYICSFLTIVMVIFITFVPIIF